jgi:hypothetical protein
LFEFSHLPQEQMNARVSFCSGQESAMSPVCVPRKKSQARSQSGKEFVMKSLRNRILAIAVLGLAVVAANAVPAAAQSAFQGSFTLPTDVRWQNATLPAGHYTFWMKSTATPSQIELRGPKGAFILANTASISEPGGRSVLVIEHRGTSRVIRELYLAPIGMRLRYSVPKLPKTEELAQGPSVTEEVLVAFNK